MTNTPPPPPSQTTLPRSKEQVFSPTINCLFRPKGWEQIHRTLLLALPCLHMATSSFILLLGPILTSILPSFCYNQKSQRQTFLTPMRWPLHFHVGCEVQTFPLQTVGLWWWLSAWVKVPFVVYVNVKAKTHPSVDLLCAFISFFWYTHTLLRMTSYYGTCPFSASYDKTSQEHLWCPLLPSVFILILLWVLMAFWLDSYSRN